ncbi:MAG: carboxypeptidase regulatory-like domain-containing protein [Pseudomonadota bacterium]
MQRTTASGICFLIVLVNLTISLWVPHLGATDLSAMVELERSRLRYDRFEKISYVDITLLNTSSQTLAAPLRVIIDTITPPDVTVANADGFTGSGKPYFDFQSPSFLLPAGVSGVRQFQFNNPQRRRFDFTVGEISGDIKQPDSSPPMADAGPNRTYVLAQGQTQVTVTLDGSASSDTGGTIIAYIWTGNPDPGDTVNPQVTLSQGSYTFTLVVVDNDFNSSSPDTVTITVESSGSSRIHPPEIELDTAAVTVNPGGSAIINAWASDPDGEILTLSASPAFGNARFSTVPGTHPTGTFILTPDATQQGLYVISFTARDPLGYTAVKTAQIRINKQNRPPQITVQPNASVKEGGLITIPITATDPDFDILTLTTSPLPDNCIFVAATKTITFAPDFTQAGSYPITCTADDGNLTDSKQVTVLVSHVAQEPAGKLDLKVNPSENPSLQPQTRVTGSVNMALTQPVTIDSALITSVEPSTGKQGDTVSVTLMGEPSGDFATHFAAKESQASFGQGITVKSVTVFSPNQLEAEIIIDAGAEIGIRGPMVKTSNEKAVSMVAFRIAQGTAGLTGKVIDPETGKPIANAVVTLQGTGFTTLTNAGGTFSFTDVPTGNHTLVVNPPDHELMTYEVAAVYGETADLGNLESRSLVFDPTADPSASIHSLLNRGINDVTGRITLDEAQKLIIDTMILVGGNEAGVLDPYGNQLNPYVDGAGITSLKNHGVQIYAEKLARGGGVPLIDMLYDISFAFGWTPRRPTLQELLGGLQSRVNQAWANPNDPASALPIVLFNFGRTLTPNPPTLTSETQLTQFQAYILVNSFMCSNYTAKSKTFGSKLKPEATNGAAGSPMDALSSRQATVRSADDSTYSITWETLKTGLGLAAADPISDVVTKDQAPFPSAEDIYRKYYLGLNTETAKNGVEELKALLIAHAGTTKDEIEEALNIRGNAAFHWALQETMNKAKDLSVLRQELETFTGNIGSTMEVDTGVIQVGDTSHFTGSLNSTVLLKSLAPDPPFIKVKESKEKVSPVTIGTQTINLPSAEIVFFRSSQEKSNADANARYYYRLWRAQSSEKIKTTDPITGKENEDPSDMVLLNVGRAGSSSIGAPTVDKDNDHLMRFVDPMPPPGRNSYRVDCVKVTGEASIIEDLKDSDLAKLDPWFAGFMGEPIVLGSDKDANILSALGRLKVHPGQGFLKDKKDVWHYTSPLSNTVAIYITGEPAHLRTFPRMDLAVRNAVPESCIETYEKTINSCAEEAGKNIKTYCSSITDPEAYADCVGRYLRTKADCIASAKVAKQACVKNSNTVYLSIPSIETSDRGSGIIFSYDYDTSSLTQFTAASSMFMKPGQSGLAIDSQGDLFTDNAASDASYGGRIFRFGGLASPNYGTRILVGSVNYFSQLVNFAHPASVQQLICGAKEELFVADALSKTVKRIGLKDSDIANAGHNVGHDWAKNPNPLPAGADSLAFGPQTDMAFDRDYTRLFITQGSKVIFTPGGEVIHSVASDPTFFTNTSGCTVCGDQKQYLFISDDIPSPDPNDPKGKIYRIPMEDIPITVPVDPVERAKLLVRYTFLEGLDQPGQIRIADDSSALIIVDNKGFRYLRFGFTGIAVGLDDRPLIGAVVTVNTPSGTYSTTSDTTGNYQFVGINLSQEPQAFTVHIQHPDHSYTDRIYLGGKCHSNLDPAPCVNITSPADGAKTASAKVTVNGVVLPKTFNFVDGVLLVNGEDYPATLNGDNEFIVPDVILASGENTISFVVNAAGPYTAASSLPVKIYKTGSPPDTQATAGVIYAADGETPLAGVTVKILVDGDLAAERETDSCGYYHAGELPLGAVSVDIEE